MQCLMPNSGKVGDVRLIEKCHLIGAPEIARNFPRGEEMAKAVVIIKTNTYLQHTLFQALL